MAGVQPLIDAGIMPLAILGKKDGFFVSASFPAHLGLFGGLYVAKEGATLDEAVEAILGHYSALWEGL